MILSFKVVPGTAAAMYATGDKVYFKGGKWTEHRHEATNFDHIGALLQSFSEFVLNRDERMPDENLDNYSIEEQA